MSFKRPEKPESIADAIPHKQVNRYACLAHQCPMTGSMFGEGGNGVCVYHFGTNSHDWPRITHTLLDWAIVTEEINHCRRVLTNPETASSPAVIEAEFRKAVQRVEQCAGQWINDLKPQLTRGGKLDSYGTWSQRLERFMGQRVVEALRHQIGRKAA